MNRILIYGLCLLLGIGCTTPESAAHLQTFELAQQDPVTSGFVQLASSPQLTARIIRLPSPYGAEPFWGVVASVPATDTEIEAADFRLMSEQAEYLPLRWGFSDNLSEIPERHEDLQDALTALLFVMLFILVIMILVACAKEKCPGLSMPDVGSSWSSSSTSSQGHLGLRERLAEGESGVVVLVFPQAKLIPEEWRLVHDSL